MPIKFDQVYFVYERKTPLEKGALRGIDLDIFEGTFTALVGRTGCGKSTLIQHLNALFVPTSGTVYIDDFINSSNKKIRSKKTKPLRQSVGVVFQFPEYQLFEETVEKDVAFGPKNFGDKPDVALEKAHAALAAVGLDETFYSRSPFELSGGEKRRVAIAGILAMKPKYLVVDEPTAGLDPLGAKDIMNLFAAIHQEGTTVVLVTHDMDNVVEYCDNVIVLDHGKIARSCAAKDLFGVDMDQYSLQPPILFDFASKLAARGIPVDPHRLNSVEDLAKAVAEAKRR